MSDRRIYGRLATDIKALIYVGENHKETDCFVRDISEMGICFKVPVGSFDANEVKFGDIIDFQFVDNYTSGKDLKSDTIISKGIVRYVTEGKEYIKIGCCIRSDDYKRYVESRKFANYRNNLALSSRINFA